MNHGTASVLVDDLRREDGILVSTDASGHELRLHRAGLDGQWEVREWRLWGVDGTTWIGPLRWSLTPSEWAVCGAAMAAMKVTKEWEDSMSEPRRSGPDVAPVVGMVFRYGTGKPYVLESHIGGFLNCKAVDGRGPAHCVVPRSSWNEGVYTILSTPETPETPDVAPMAAKPCEPWCGLPYNDPQVPAEAPGWPGMRGDRYIASAAYCRADWQVCRGRIEKSSPAEGDVLASAGRNTVAAPVEESAALLRQRACDAIPFNARCSTACWQSRRHVEPKPAKAKEWKAPSDCDLARLPWPSAAIQFVTEGSAVAKLPDFHSGTRNRHMEPRWPLDRDMVVACDSGEAE